MRFIPCFAAACLLFASGFPSLHAQVGAGKDPVAAPARMPDIAWNLDGLLASAMRSNPEVLLAEAKVRQAQAELNQVRLQVTRSVMELLAEREAAVQRIAFSERTMGELKSLAGSGHAAVAEVAKAEADFLDARSGLTRIEARARYLCGSGPVAGAASRDPLLAAKDDPFAADATAPGGAAAPNAFRRSSPAAEPRPRLPDALADRLNRKIEGSITEGNLGAALEMLRKSGGFAVVVDPSFGDAEELLEKPVTFAAAEPMPVSAWMQAIADTCEVVFVARDYGFLVTVPDRAESFDAATIPALRTVR